MEKGIVKRLGEERFAHAARPLLDIRIQYPLNKTIVGDKDIRTSYTDSFGGLANTIVFKGNKVLSVTQTHGTYEEGKKRHEEISNSIKLGNLAN